MAKQLEIENDKACKKAFKKWFEDLEQKGEWEDIGPENAFKAGWDEALKLVMDRRSK